MRYFRQIFRIKTLQSLIYEKKIKPTNLDNREVGSFFLDLDTDKHNKNEIDNVKVIEAVYLVETSD